MKSKRIDVVFVILKLLDFKICILEFINFLINRILFYLVFIRFIGLDVNIVVKCYVGVR